MKVNKKVSGIALLSLTALCLASCQKQETSSVVQKEPSASSVKESSASKKSSTSKSFKSSGDSSEKGDVSAVSETMAEATETALTGDGVAAETGQNQVTEEFVSANELGGQIGQWEEPVQTGEEVWIDSSEVVDYQEIIDYGTSYVKPTPEEAALIVQQMFDDLPQFVDAYVANPYGGFGGTYSSTVLAELERQGYWQVRDQMIQDALAQQELASQN